MRATERAIADDAMDDETTVRTRGRQPGAHGRQAPHRNVKPGTRRSIEEADPRAGED